MGHEQARGISFNYTATMSTGHHQIIASWALGLSKLLLPDVLALCKASAVRTADDLNLILKDLHLKTFEKVPIKSEIS